MDWNSDWKYCDVKFIIEMFPTIPVAKHYIPLISFSCLKSMDRIGGTVLHACCIFPRWPEWIPQIQKAARKHKANTGLLTPQSVARAKSTWASAHGGQWQSLLGVLKLAEANKALGWSVTWIRDKISCCPHVSTEGLRLTWNLCLGLV